MKTNTHKTRIILLATTSLLSLNWSAPASADEKRYLISAFDEENLYASIDADILSQIHHVNELEIKLGTMVTQKTGRQDVKDFAQMLINDHAEADVKVIDLAKSKGLTLREFSPVTARERAQARQEAAVERSLNNSANARFNRIYLVTMRDDHNKKIRWLESVQDNIQYTETKDLVQSLLPTLRAHRDQAIRLLALPTE